LEASLELESRLDAVGSARRFTRSTLESWSLEAFVDDAVLVASELIANAVLHARTTIVLTIVARDRSSVRVEVYDENTRMPIAGACPRDATSGRGLSIVAGVAAAWGAEQRGDGKVVWADVTGISRDDQLEYIDLRRVDNVDQALEEVDGHSRPTATAPRRASSRRRSAGA
jgi:serine/threonine-protein kinase RsbW